MKSTKPKVLHEIAGRSLLGHVLHATSALSSQSTTVVVGAGKDDVIAHLSAIASDVATVYQEIGRAPRLNSSHEWISRMPSSA